MSNLTIAHTHAEGTMIDGTTRGDGTAEILKAKGWRWSRNLGAWYVPHSRDRVLQPGHVWAIDRTAAALREAGFDVDIEIDDTVRPTAEVEAVKVARQADRVDALTAKAEELTDRAASQWERSRQMADAIPFGQPILVGHHSERADRRYRDKIIAATDKAVETYREASAASGKVAAAAGTTDARYSPVTVGNRIQKLQSELHRASREGWSEARTRKIVDQLDFWNGVRAQQICDGLKVYGPDTITRGDAVKHGSSWWLVERVNTTSVTLVSQGCRVLAKYHTLTGHRARTATPLDAPECTVV